MTDPKWMSHEELEAEVKRLTAERDDASRRFILANEKAARTEPSQDWMGSIRELYNSMPVVITNEAKSLAQRLADVLDGVPDQARATCRAEALSDVVAKLRGAFSNYPAGMNREADAYNHGISDAIAAVREMGEKP